MIAIAEIDVQPIGSGVSIRDQVAAAVEKLRQAGLKIRIHSLGTEVEGELSQVLEAVNSIHRDLHEAGVERLITNLKVETRTDHSVEIEDAVRVVEGLISEPKRSSDS